MRNDDTAWWQKLYLDTNDDDDDDGDNHNDLCISAADTDDYFMVLEEAQRFENTLNLFMVIKCTYKKYKHPYSHSCQNMHTDLHSIHWQLYKVI